MAAVMQFFTYAHLKEPLQAVSKPFCDLAQRVLETLPDSPERVKALDRLLEAKDAAVRALIYKPEPPLFVAHPGSSTVDKVPDPKPTAPGGSS